MILMTREIKKIRLDEENEPSALVVTENVPSENVSNKVQIMRNTAKCRRSRKLTIKNKNNKSTEMSRMRQDFHRNVK